MLVQIWSWISRKVLGHRLQEEDVGFALTSENLEMLLQFKRTIETVLISTLPPAADTPEAIAHGEIAEILAQPAHRLRWVDLYKAELLLAQIRPAAQLPAEIRKAAARARDETADGTSIFDAEIRDLLHADLETDAKAAARARALLQRLLRGQHWKHSQRFLKRRIRLVYTQRILIWLFAIFALYVAALALAAALWPGEATGGWQPWIVYAGSLVAFAAGLLGASFSTLTGHAGALNGISLEGAQVAASHAMIALRVGVGGTAAVILYFFFESGLVSGLAFPDLEALGFAPVHLAGTAEGAGAEHTPLGVSVPNADLSKLMVWSFLAGFSEKLVPTILGRVERSGEGG